MARRPTYLEDEDVVQDVIEDAGGEPVTLRQLVVLTRRNYTAVQKATASLRSKNRIAWERRSQVLYFYPKP